MTLIKIKVEYVPIITDVTRKDAEEIFLASPSLKELLSFLSQLYGPPMENLLWTAATGERSKYVLTVVNGDVVHEEEYFLEDGDTVLIMPTLAGG